MIRKRTFPAFAGCRRLLFAGLLALALPLLTGCPQPDEPGYYLNRLKLEDEEVRRRAIEELVRMQKKAMPLIEETLQSEDPDQRQGAAEFLSRVRRMQSLELLEEPITDPNKKVRLQAIGAVSELSQVWKDKAVELLSRAFEESGPEGVKKAGEGLRDMEYEEATAVLERQFEQAEGIEALYAARFLYEIRPAPQTAQVLLEGLISDDKNLRDAAKENVNDLQNEIVEPLVRFVDSGEAVARARRVLHGIRDDMIEELDVILDRKRAEKLLTALGTIADAESVEKLNSDLRDTKLESAWRVAAATAMARAAQSPRCPESLRRSIQEDLTEVMRDEGVDNRIRIGASIALSRLKQEHAVTFLLNQLDKFEEAMRTEGISKERLDDLTALRIRAQEALTASGDFVVPFLMERLGGTAEEPPGPIIKWAAAKTFGELKIQKGVPFLGEYLTAKKKPLIRVSEEGGINVVQGLSDERREELSFIFAEQGTTRLKRDWRDLTDEQIQQIREAMEIFEYPHYLRWTCGVALERIGGQEARRYLQQAWQAERDFLARLSKVQADPDYAFREPVISGLARSHNDVLFYVRRGAPGSEGQHVAQSTGS